MFSSRCLLKGKSWLREIDPVLFTRSASTSLAFLCFIFFVFFLLPYGRGNGKRFATYPYLIKQLGGSASRARCVRVIANGKVKTKQVVGTGIYNDTKTCTFWTNCVEKWKKRRMRQSMLFLDKNIIKYITWWRTSSSSSVRRRRRPIRHESVDPCTNWFIPFVLCRWKEKKVFQWKFSMTSLRYFQTRAELGWTTGHPVGKRKTNAVIIVFSFPRQTWRQVFWLHINHFKNQV